MKRKTFVLAAVAVAAIATTTLALLQNRNDSVEELTMLGQSVSHEKITLGRDIYTQTCASCHGKNLEGQPDWKRRLYTGRMPAPPHDDSGHTWHHSDQILFNITKLGVGSVVKDYESDMPAFAETLSDDEIAAALAFIKSTWPERPRNFQSKLNTGNGSGS